MRMSGTSDDNTYIEGSDTEGRGTDHSMPQLR